MTNNKIMVIAGRTWTYFVQGLSGYLGIMLSLLSSYTIIYTYIISRYIQSSTFLFVLGIALIGISALLLGLLAKKTGFWHGSVEASSEINPYLSKILGKKDLLGWQQNLISTELSIAITKTEIAFYKKQGLDTSKIEERLEELIKFKTNIEEMLKTANS